MINISGFGIFPLLLKMGQGISVTHTVRVTDTRHLPLWNCGSWGHTIVCPQIETKLSHA